MSAYPMCLSLPQARWSVFPCPGICFIYFDACIIRQPQGLCYRHLLYPFEYPPPQKSLTIIQIWHALGAIKKFGYQTLNREGGRNEKIARLMEMHRNYDYVLCASEATKQLYAEAFDISPDRIIITGIPRIDAILEANTEENRNELYRSHPALLKKGLFYMFRLSVLLGFRILMLFRKPLILKLSSLL